VGIGGCSTRRSPGDETNSNPPVLGEFAKVITQWRRLLALVAIAAVGGLAALSISTSLALFALRAPSR